MLSFGFYFHHTLPFPARNECNLLFLAHMDVGTNISFFDSANELLFTAEIAGYDNCTWKWSGWIFDKPLKYLILHGPDSNGGGIWFDQVAISTCSNCALNGTLQTRAMPLK